MKRPKKSAPKKLKINEPVNDYTSKCCSAQATKTPVQSFGMRSKEAETQGLGSWRCMNCHKRCACTRSKRVLDKS